MSSGSWPPRVRRSRYTARVVTLSPSHVSPRVQAAALGVLAFVARVTGGAGAELDLEVVVASLLLLTHADDLAREGAWKILTNVAEV